MEVSKGLPSKVFSQFQDKNFFRKDVLNILHCQQKLDIHFISLNKVGNLLEIYRNISPNPRARRRTEPQKGLEPGGA